MWDTSSRRAAPPGMPTEPSRVDGAEPRERLSHRLDPPGSAIQTDLRSKQIYGDWIYLICHISSVITASVSPCPAALRYVVPRPRSSVPNGQGPRGAPATVQRGGRCTRQAPRERVRSLRPVGSPHAHVKSLWLFVPRSRSGREPCSGSAHARFATGTAPERAGLPAVSPNWRRRGRCAYRRPAFRKGTGRVPTPLLSTA